MKILYAILICWAIFSCKNSEDTAVATTEMSSPGMNISMPEKQKAVADADSDSGNPTGQKIIKESSLRFETSDLNEVHQKILNAVRIHQGVIQNDVEGKDSQSLFRNIVVRIPSNNFDEFLNDVSKGVNYFDRKEITARDVTEEYIDIDARLKAKKMLESRYLELLKRATKITEMLEIEKQLSTIREEIEAKEGQLRYMQSQISMSTVNIEFYKRTELEGGVTVSYGSKMWNAVKSGFNGISVFFIGVLYMWPFIVILVVLIYFLRWRFRSKKTN